MMTECKAALRVTDTEYDAEVAELIQAAKDDLEIAGVVVDGINVTVTYNDDGTVTVTDTSADVLPAVKQAVKTYVRLHFGSPDDYDRLEKTYNEQKAQLVSHGPTTDWGDDE